MVRSIAPLNQRGGEMSTTREHVGPLNVIGEKISLEAAGVSKD